MFLALSRRCTPHHAGLAVALVLAGVLAAAAAAPVSAQIGATTSSRTVWEGVYTDAQAQRAVEMFNQSCARCHSLVETGRSPLIGSGFWAHYSQTTVGDLLTYIRTSMPNGGGGSLPAATYNDIVALILRSNGFPSGSVELAPDTVADVRIVPKDGSTILPANALARVVGCLTRQGPDWVVTHATTPERVMKSGAAPEDATRALGDRTMPLKFVISRLDAFAGGRVSASGLLLGTGGSDGINVMMVERVSDTCP